MKSRLSLTMTLIAALSLAAFGGALAEAASSESNQTKGAGTPVQPQLVRSNAGDSADAPSGRLLLRVPSLTDQAGGSVPSVERNEPPVEPANPGTENGEDGPTFFGEPASGTMLFIIDASWSMWFHRDVGGGEDYEGNSIASMSRMDCVRYEMVRLLQGIGETDSFDFIMLAGWDEDPPPGISCPSKPVTHLWKGRLIMCTDHVRAEAINFIKTVETWYGTPTHEAIRRACVEYGHEIDQLFFLSDGAPYPEVWRDGRNHKEAILADFPGLFAPMASHGCKLTCFHIGQDVDAGTFMQEFAAANGAKYIKR